MTLKATRAPDRFLLLGHIDHPTAALPNLLEQLVVADLIPRLLGQWDGDVDRRAGWRRDGLRHEVAGLLMRLEQRLHALPQLSITSAGLVEVASTLFGWQLKRCLKEGFFAFGRSVHGI